MHCVEPMSISPDDPSSDKLYSVDIASEVSLQSLFQYNVSRTGSKLHNVTAVFGTEPGTVGTAALLFDMSGANKRGRT